MTVCTKDRKNLLGAVGEATGLPQNYLSETGRLVDEAIQNIPVIYPDFHVDNYVIMPNHVHMIIVILRDGGGRSMNAPTISRVIRQFKEVVARKPGSRR